MNKSVSKVVLYVGLCLFCFIDVWIETYNRMNIIEHDFTTEKRPTYPQPTSSPVSAAPTGAPIIDPNQIHFCKVSKNSI